MIHNWHLFHRWWVDTNDAANHRCQWQCDVGETVVWKVNGVNGVNGVGEALPECNVATVFCLTIIKVGALYILYGDLSNIVHARRTDKGIYQVDEAYIW